MQPDLRKLICEHIIRVLQQQKDVNQKQHISVKHDFVWPNSSVKHFHITDLEFYPRAWQGRPSFSFLQWIDEIFKLTWGLNTRVFRRNVMYTKMGTVCLGPRWLLCY
ncbi:hypothetical protein TNCV_936161 [Trichonephila clavipes]|nr:hypothetical protein TNCV_936161 [Trichonephila clavipes]